MVEVKILDEAPAVLATRRPPRGAGGVCLAVAIGISRPRPKAAGVYRTLAIGPVENTAARNGPARIPHSPEGAADEPPPGNYPSNMAGSTGLEPAASGLTEEAGVRARPTTHNRVQRNQRVRSGAYRSVWGPPADVFGQFSDSEARRQMRSARLHPDGRLPGSRTAKYSGRADRRGTSAMGRGRGLPGAIRHEALPTACRVLVQPRHAVQWSSVTVGRRVGPPEPRQSRYGPS